MSGSWGAQIDIVGHMRISIFPDEIAHIGNRPGSALRDRRSVDLGSVVASRVELSPKPNPGRMLALG